MNVEVIKSDSVCDYCKNKYDYKGTGEFCRVWYFENAACEDAIDFEGLELIVVEE